MRIPATLLIALLASPAAAGPFDAPPGRYADTVNPVLQQVGSQVRVRKSSCTTGTPPSCRFAAGKVAIEASGEAEGDGTEQITLGIVFRRGGEAEAAGLLRDALTVLGATMVAYDPAMGPERRSKVLQDLGTAALSIGEAHMDSDGVHYGLRFDDVSGHLEILVTPLGPEGHRGTRPQSGAPR